MQQYTTGEQNLAVSFAFIAGFVDSIGFIFLGGVFLSFMSGNTTRIATASVEGNPDLAWLAGSAVVFFLLGVMLGALVRRLAQRRVPADRVREVVMITMCGLFTLAAVLVLIDVPHAAIIVASLGIGSMNSIFERQGEVSIPLTYMTGTLVKMGQRFVDAFFGGSHAAWLGHLKMWAGLTAGAFTGATVYHWLGIHALYVVALLTWAVTAVSLLWRMWQRRHATGAVVKLTVDPF
ncbi:YoaK family protein [Corynebacterium sp.]|uniref:YoaK family protein n=1 Tax=Corynebacterium sp. TaxID=1720 RepID=UPI0026E0469F|nr:YoaK family protein [Corynebacterium sp.]MDO5511783.1 YoaK family protein [Corynebacterium sp.]